MTISENNPVGLAGAPDGSLKVAVIGSGPAGFYAAGQLLAAPDRSVQVDMFDRLPTPWGLVRAGVAPDHPKIKSVSRVFEKTARLQGFRFLGNVEVGRDVSHAELMDHYHIVMYAFGAARDRKLGIPGEDKAGSHAATEFVAWYNGHPDYSDRSFDLSATRAVVIGNGNVALDVARLLALTPEELAGTDIADHALDALRVSRITEIVVLGRRGPAQAAFTEAELRELGHLADADVVVDPADLVLDAASHAWLDAHPQDMRARNNLQILQAHSQRPPAGKRKRIVLRFFTAPTEITGDRSVTGVKVARTVLETNGPDSVRARLTNEVETIQAGVVLRSIGYTGTSIPGVPFDETRGVIHNEDGRVRDGATGEALTGVYAAGWIKRGPSGVIGTNRKCAQQTVEHLFEDLAAGRIHRPSASPDELIARLRERGAEIVDYRGWEAIDQYERSAGAAHGRPRVKVVRHDALLARATGTTLGADD